MVLSWIEPFEHEMNHSDMNPGLRAFRLRLFCGGSTDFCCLTSAVTCSNNEENNNNKVLE